MDYLARVGFFDWVWTPLGVAGTLLLGVGYGWAVVAASRRGHPVPWARVLLWYGAGVLPFAVATGCGWLRLRTITLLPTVLQETALLQVVPAGLALGDPLGVLGGALGSGGRERMETALSSRLIRLLANPLITPLLCCAITLLFTETAWMQVTTTNPLAWQLSCVGFVVMGLLFAVPMLADESSLLPGWATAGVRVGIAALDGLVDSVPALLVMLATAPLWHPTSLTTSLPHVIDDQQSSGALMFCLAEVVGLPVIIGAAVQWARSDHHRGSQVDAQLDEFEARGGDLTRPWWDQDG